VQRALDVPRDRVWAASTHVRVIDAAMGQVVSGAQLSHAINDMAFTADGRRAFVASSDGMYEIDVETTKLGAHLTTSPARQVLIAPDGKSIGVLEHDVVVGKDGARTVMPFRWKTVSLDDGKVLSTETAGDRVLAVAPGYGTHASVVLFEAGVVMLVPAGQALEKGGRALDLAGGQEPLAFGKMIPRQYLTVNHEGTRAYFPVEGTPSRILEVDLVAGTSRAIALGGQLHLRGLALSPDEKKLVVNAMRSMVVVDLVTAKVTGSIELGAAHTGAVVSEDGSRVYLAQTVDEKGGAVTIVGLDPLRVQGKIHLDDISPWVIGIAPRAAMASAR